MSEWRRKAMALFPDRVGTLHKATSLHDLWFTLLQDIQEAYRTTPQNGDLIERIWTFAGWCFAPGRNSTVRNAVAVSFYEHLPHYGPARRDMPVRLSRQALEELIPALRTTLTAPELAAFLEEFLSAQGVDKPSIRRIVRTAS
jgi:hypothetical protein